MIRIIGDTHGINHRFPARPYLAREAEDNARTYIKLLSEVDYSIQLGDLGWGKDLDSVRGLDPTHHRHIKGNHCSYDEILPHSLGDYGITSLNGVQFGFVRGEYSIDKMYRDHFGPYKSWWEQEELTDDEALSCIDFFSALGDKPSLMLTHGCPNFLLGKELGLVTNNWDIEPSFTSKLLARVYEIVQPKLWVFGHFHKNWVHKHENTTFVCLNELCYADVSVDNDKYTLSGDINLQI